MAATLRCYSKLMPCAAGHGTGQSSWAWRDYSRVPASHLSSSSAWQQHSEHSGRVLGCCRSQYVWLFQAPVLPEMMIAANDYAALRDSFLGDKMGVKTTGMSAGKVHDALCGVAARKPHAKGL